MQSYKKVVRRGKNMMRIEPPPGFFDPDFQLLNYTCENGCCEIVLHIKGRRKGKTSFGQDERQQKRLQNDAANQIPSSIDF